MATDVAATMSASASAAGPGVASAPASGNNNNSILSSKVSRALEVRSDTPAMKAALEALAQLHPSSLQGTDGGGATGAANGTANKSGTTATGSDDGDDLFAVDSRSVRVAIEQDALQQALLLQDELQTLLGTVRQLRQGVTETATLARRVDEVVHSNVITASVVMSQQQQQQDDPAANMADGVDLGSSTLLTSSTTTTTTTDAALEQEQRLAMVLSDCFNRRNVARQRVSAVHEFLERFDLSEEDSRLLDHYNFEDLDVNNGMGMSNYVNGNAFLAALERVRLIRKELGNTFGSIDPGSKRRSDMSSSSAAIGSGSSSMSSSSALRMMETLAQKQERAYERLYHWLQKYLHVHNHEHGASSGGDASMHPQDDDRLDEALSHPFVRRSLLTLKNVPAFYSHLLELIAQSRRSEETRRFLLALTSGYGGMPPIEMRAHDSVVYVGDMLAFCFRAFNVEADVARNLLKLDPETVEEGDEEKDEEPSNNDTQQADGAAEDTDYVAEQPITAVEMLVHSMGGISRPLKSRILQVISNLARRADDDDNESDDGMDDLDEEGAEGRKKLCQLYEICGLLLFYASALDKAIMKVYRNASSSTSFAAENDKEISEQNPLLTSIMECLDEATKAYGASLRVYGALLDQLNALTGDSEASLAHSMIVRVVDVRKASPGFVEDVKCPEKYQQTLSVDWSCEVLVEAALPSCRSLDDTVALKQAIAVARQGGLSELQGLALEDKIREQETTLIEQVVAKEANDVLDLCGLGPLIVAWDRFEGVKVDGMMMSSYPGLTPEEVAASMKEFYSSLYSPPIPSFENSIKDPTLRKVARAKIAKTVCDKYRDLYEAMQEDDGYDMSVFGHTPSQVGTLFQA